MNCRNLAVVSFSLGIIKLNRSCFENCTSLHTIFNTNGVFHVSRNAFLNCILLDKFDFDSVYTIDSRAFSNTGFRLISLKHADSLKKSCFANCKRLETIEIQNTSPSIFENCTKLAKVYFGRSVHEIKDRAFFGCTSLKSFDFTDTTKICVNAFAYTGLVEVDIGSIPIETGAFSNCNNLFNFSCDLTRIESYTFDSCSHLKHFTDPFLEFIDKFAFRGTAIESIDLSNVKTISNNALCSMTHLLKVNISSLNDIPSESFWGCTQLSQITFSQNIFSIGERAFEFCTKLKNIELFNVSDIGKNAFGFCETLTSVKLPLCKIASSCFVGCLNIFNFEGPMAVKGVLFMDKYLVQYPCGHDVEFYRIPSGTLSIGESAFRNTHLVKIFIPSSVEFIADGAFAFSTSLESIDVDSNSKFFNTHQGALFNSTTLLQIPIAKTGRFCIPPSIVAIVPEGMAGARADITVAKGANLQRFKGCIYSSNFEILYHAPFDVNEVILHQMTEKIEKYAVLSNSLEKIVFNDKLKNIEKFAFSRIRPFTIFENLPQIENVSEAAFGMSKEVIIERMPNVTNIYKK